MNDSNHSVKPTKDEWKKLGGHIVVPIVLQYIHWKQKFPWWSVLGMAHISSHDFLCCVRKRNHIYLVLRVRGLFRLSSFRTCLLDLTFHLSGYFDDEKLTEVGKIHEDIESRLILPKETNLTVSVWASWKFTNESSLYVFCVLPLPLSVFKVDIRAFETLFRQDKKDIKKRPLICSGINRECTSVLWSWRTRNQGSRA